jgi:hypothetical protein
MAILARAKCKLELDVYQTKDLRGPMCLPVYTCL